MANLKKYTRADAGKILRHNERQTLHKTNKDIDPTRTHLNYSLIQDGKTARERYDGRMGQVRCYNRKDVKSLCSWVITAPKTLPVEQHEAFFHGCFEFVGNRYGGENMVQGVVHMDETTPHIHITYIPVTDDPKHDCEKVCANIVNNREDLATFHRDLEEALLERGIRADVCTGVTRAQGGNRTVEQLKAAHDKGKEEDREAAGFRWEDYVADHRHTEPDRDRDHDHGHNVERS